MNAALSSTDIHAQDNLRQIIPASRLSAWCDRIIEFGWIAAVIVVPLFFNIYSSRVFEPDKLTTLRSIAIVMCVAWLVKWFEERRNPNRDTQLTWRTALVLPTVFLVVVYVISTALSVAPRTSLLGSYQRLQGTYTTFSYIVVFFMLLQGLRTRAQLERLLTLMVINSFPIAVYGLLQRLKMDPLPWGGDTVDRVAGNMGNSIFIAAYLIMTFFVNLYKIADSFVSIFRTEKPRVADVVRAACYIVILLMSAVVITTLAGSRGPQLGFFAGLFFLMLLMVQLLRKRSLRFGLTVGSILLGVAGLAFLIWINFAKDNPTAESLRQNVPLFTKLSSVMQTTNGTNAVRVLIWEGAVRLVLPHSPIQNPDGTPDQFNALRPFFGYGPESMYVAYNRFYPPRLANFEARNASPDRSHNETWDSLVITGLVGFIAYMALFGSVFYYGFRWIGLIATRFEKLLFPVLYIAGGLLAGGYLWSIGEQKLFGVGVAAGVAAGLALFLVVSALINALRKEGEDVRSSLSLRDQMLLIAIVSTIVAHFVEIHTGIAIASTRTHFWVLIGVMVVVGLGWMKVEPRAMSHEPRAMSHEPRAMSQVSENADNGEQRSNVSTSKPANLQTSQGKRRQRAAQSASVSRQTRSAPRSRSGFNLPDWFGTVASYGLLLGLVLGIMSFDFTNNIPRYTNAAQLFIKALVELPNQGSSYGVLLMFLLTLGLGVGIIVSELHREGALRDNNANVLPAAALVVSIAVFVWFAFGTFIAGRLVDFITTQAGDAESILRIAEQLAQFPVYVYLLIGAIMLIGAWALRDEDGVRAPKGMASVGGLSVGLVGLIVAPFTISYSNLQPIQADIIYKQASPWDQQGARQIAGPNSPVQAWDLGIAHHRRAIQLAPNEDFYYLWLGRGLLEKARSTPSQETTRRIQDNDNFSRIIDDKQLDIQRAGNQIAIPTAGLSQADLLAAAKIILQEARVINPLNTDHSANLARMWTQTAGIAKTPEERDERLKNSDKEYGTATNLSPNNAQIWNEWANLKITQGKFDEAQVKLDQSLKIDPKFDSTYLLRASLLLQQAEQFNAKRQQAQQALASVPVSDTAKVDEAKQTLAQTEQPWRDTMQKAIPELEGAVKVNPNNTQALGQMLLIYQQLGNLPKAIESGEAIVKISDKDWNAYRNLAVLYRDSQQKEKALENAKKSLALAPQEQQATLQAFVQQLGGQ
jgi:tetratricopeptide (TPR) repeat protein